MIRRVSVIGLGLIGGSLCLSWKKRLPELIIEGHDAKDVLIRAKERGAIDHACFDIEDLNPASDLIVIATPITTSLSIVEKLASIISPGTILTDVGSVKRPISEFARTCLSSENPFIGGHPMAGSEKKRNSSCRPFSIRKCDLCADPGQRPNPCRTGSNRQACPTYRALRGQGNVARARAARSYCSSRQSPTSTPRRYTDESRT